MENKRIYIRKAVLSWCALLAISVLLGYSIFNAFSSRIYANVFESMNNNLQFAESSYDVFMSQMKMGMLQASVEPGIKELILKKDAAALKKLFREWGNHRYYVNEWYVVDRDGVIISSAGKNLFVLSDEKARIQSIIQQAMESGSVSLGTALIRDNSKGNESTLMQYVVVPVLENDSQAIGAIVTVMNLNGDTNIIGKIMDDTGMYSVITAKDRIIASSLESGLYRFNIGGSLSEEIHKEVIEKGVPYIGRIRIYSTQINNNNLYFGAFRPIKDAEGSTIGAQGIIYYDRLAEATLGQIRDFTIIVVILLVAVFTIIAWSYLKTQKMLLKEKQFSNKLSILRKFSDLVRQASSEDEVYDILFDLLKRNSNINQVIVVRKDYGNNRLAVYKAMNNEGIDSIKSKVANEQSCLAAKTGKEYSYNGGNNDFNCKGLCNYSESYICLPIILGGIVSGVIQIQGDKKDCFTEELVSEFRIYIDTLTPVISNLRLLESLNNMASIDTLTKVYNRRYLDKHLGDQILTSKEGNLYLSVIMLDIDFFKKFNDTYGHDAGDYVLMHFAGTLRANVREGDIVARYGGEEFIVVLSHTDLQGAYEVAEKLRKKVEDMSLAAINEENAPKITCSLGISCYPLHGNSVDKLIQSADKALYKAKNSGRNRTCIFGEENEREAAKERSED
jgi:diguanylate cyclase (GGDEF)-like protein